MMIPKDLADAMRHEAQTRDPEDGPMISVSGLSCDVELTLATDGSVLLEMFDWNGTAKGRMNTDQCIELAAALVAMVKRSREEQS